MCHPHVCGVARCGLLLIGLLCDPLVLPTQAQEANKHCNPAKAEIRVTVPEGVHYSPDLTYRTLGQTELKLDLARPAEGKGLFPAVILLNGGSWMDLGGNRKLCVLLQLRLAQQGCVAVAITHRSARTNPFPAQIHDAKAAVRWLRLQANKHRIDPDRIAAVGFSSGGHLACLLGATTPADGLEEPEADPRVSSRVQAVVACYAPTDLLRLRQDVESGKPNWLLAQAGQRVLNKLLPREKGVDWTTRAIAITYARREVAPLLLIHGSQDTVVPCEQSKRYADKLKAAGASVRLLELADAKHGFGSGLGGAAGKQSDDATVEFLLQHLHAGASHK